MRFWWINHKQTFRHEVKNGYIWCPKTKKNGQLDPHRRHLRDGQVVESSLALADILEEDTTTMTVEPGAPVTTHADLYPDRSPRIFPTTHRVNSNKAFRLNVLTHSIQRGFRESHTLKPSANLADIHFFNLLSLLSFHPCITATTCEKRETKLREFERLA